MDRLRILSLLVVCAVLGCRQGAVSATEGELLVQPPAVDFGRTWLGHRGSAKLSLQNTARRGVDVTLELEPPFDVQGAVHVGGGERLEVDLGVTGTELGFASGFLLVSANGTTQRVALRAEVLAPPQCSSVDCRAVVFNPVTGACDESLEVDGTACGATNACISAGTCAAGVCVGRSRDCNDGDACTTDACDPSTGCVHAVLACPSSERVCEVAVCSPQTGCGFAPAGDGASCGANDCVTAEVCITGQCVARPAPDGSECAPATSCRAPGQCRAQRCELPPPRELQPSWRYSPPPGFTLAFFGAVDDLGNLYATETAPAVQNADQNGAPAPGTAFEDRLVLPSPTNLISLSPTGVVRFRAQVTSDCASCIHGLWLSVDSGGHKVFVNAKGVTHAFSTDDGRELWSTVPTNGLPSYDVRSDGGAAFSLSAPMLVGTDNVAVPVIEGSSDHHSYVQVFDRNNGAFRWQFHRKGHLYGTGVAAGGELWTSSANCWAVAGEMARLDATGLPQATKFVQWIPSIYGVGVAIGTANGRLQLLDSALNLTDLTTMTGAGPGAQPLLTGQQLVLFDGATRSLSSVDLASGARAFTYNRVQGSSVDFELLRDGGVGWTADLPDAGLIGAVNGRGEEVLQCPLATTVDSATAIIRGRAYLQAGADLVAYEVPGLDVEPSGWVTRQGSLQRGYGAR